MRHALKFGSVVFTAGLVCGCAADSPNEGGAAGVSGSGLAGGGSGGSGAAAAGSGAGGKAGSSGTAGQSGSGLGGAGESGVSGGGSGGRAGSAGDGGTSAGWRSGSGGSAGEANAGVGGLAGSGGLAGAGGVGGGAGAGSGAAGTSGGAPSDDDRCDVAVYDADDPPASLPVSGNLGTHDPVVIEADGRYFLFSTGDNLGAKTSTDLIAWQAAPEVFTNATRPDWLAEEVPGVENLWAPDISYFGGSYHLYYSASTFGSNHSCIGHLTRASLDSGSWTDRGAVICSNNGGSNDNWNAIDPNVVLDREGKAWLSFGSFWSGLKMIELDAEGERVGTMLHSIAARPNNGGALEAPFIVRRCGYYYLFVSFDTCCQGTDSTYNQRVGRSESVTGPYVDKNGTALMQGGGTPLLSGGSRWKGPGHNAVIFTRGAAYNIYHSYDADNGGSPRLRIAELSWDADGWPISGGP